MSFAAGVVVLLVLLAWLKRGTTHPSSRPPAPRAPADDRRTDKGPPVAEDVGASAGDRQEADPVMMSVPNATAALVGGRAVTCPLDRALPAGRVIDEDEGRLAFATVPTSGSSARVPLYPEQGTVVVRFEGYGDATFWVDESGKCALSDWGVAGAVFGTVSTNDGAMVDNAWVTGCGDGGHTDAGGTFALLSTVAGTCRLTVRDCAGDSLGDVSIDIPPDRDLIDVNITISAVPGPCTPVAKSKAMAKAEHCREWDARLSLDVTEAMALSRSARGGAVFKELAAGMQTRLDDLRADCIAVSSDRSR